MKIFYIILFLIFSSKFVYAETITLYCKLINTVEMGWKKMMKLLIMLKLI